MNKRPVKEIDGSEMGDKGHYDRDGGGREEGGMSVAEFAVRDRTTVLRCFWSRETVALENELHIGASHEPQHFTLGDRAIGLGLARGDLQERPVACRRRLGLVVREG